MGSLALRWMLCEAQLAGLVIDEQRKAEVLGGKESHVAPDPLTTNQHRSLHGLWWIAEVWPKVVHVLNPQGVWRNAIRLNLGRRRIPSGSLLHESVERRLTGGALAYRPPNVPQQHGTIQARSQTVAHKERGRCSVAQGGVEKRCPIWPTGVRAEADSRQRTVDAHRSK